MPKYTYEYPRPALTVDSVVFGIGEKGLQILLIKRKDDPFKGCWALPGGFVEMDETTDEAVLRELEEETSIKDVYLEQLYTFSTVNRDPRERVVSVAYYGLVRPEDLEICAQSDAADVKWFSLNRKPKLAFDHKEIMDMAKERLKGKVRYQPIGFELLPRKFTLSQLQQVYEAILEKPLDKRNFRRILLKMGILEELAEKDTTVKHRPPRLYRFNRAEYARKLKSGFSFEV